MSATQSTLEVLRRQNRLLQKAAGLDDRFVTLMACGGGVREIVDEVAALTAKPVGFYDADLRREHVSIPANLRDKSLPALPDLAAYVGEVVESGWAVIEPLPGVQPHHRLLLCRAGAAGQTRGYLVVVEYGARFAALDRHVGRRAAASLTLALSIADRTTQSRQDARALVADALLRGDGNPELLARSAQALGVAPEAPHRLCLIASANDGSAALPDSGDAADALGRELGCEVILAAASTSGLAALIPMAVDEEDGKTDLDLKSAVERSLDRLEGRNGLLVAAVSAAFVGVADCADALIETTQLLQSLRRMRSVDPVRVIVSGDLAGGRQFVASLSHDQVMRFGACALGPLLAADKSGPLIQTLVAFFESARSARTAAAALGVHENTVRYRLGRIEQLTGLAICTDSDDQFSAQLALLILQLHGDVVASAPANG